MYKILTNGNYYKVQRVSRRLLQGRGRPDRLIWDDLLGADLKPLTFGSVEAAKMFIEKDKSLRTNKWEEVEVVE